jgi:hypothetical protein
MTYRQEDDPVLCAMVLAALVLLVFGYVWIFAEMGKLAGAS